MRKFKHTHAMLWGTTIIAAALLNAPVFITLIVLPAIAVITLKQNENSNQYCK
ncbi:MAG: hypothetical protein ACI9LM_003995 [Alteromonadaceae bacterium]|jgi:hypothetical protein